MLQIIRDRAQGFLAWIIVIIIIIPFALWGIHQYLGGGEEGAVATVNGMDIKAQELQKAYYQHRQQLEQVLGSRFDPEKFPEEKMKQQVLESLIQQALLVQTAARAGLRIGDGELGLAIRAMPAFQRNGKFSEAAYEELLRSRGYSMGGFEQSLRQDLLTAQLEQGIKKTGFATHSEQEHYLRLQGQTRDIGYMVLPLQPFETGITVSDDKAKQFYDTKTELYRIPERVKVAYVELSKDGIAKGISVSDKDLHSYYDSHLSSYKTPEERRAAHILIAVPAGAGKAKVEAARKKAEDIRKQLLAGASFAEMARKYSDDPGSAKAGGELGFFGRNVMDPAFEKSVFGMKAGQTSEPVRSAFGFHIIRLEQIRAGKVATFDEVKNKLLTDVRKERAEKAFYDKAEVMANVAYEHPDNLEAVAKRLNLTIKESEPFTRRGGKGLFANPKVVAAAFSDDVLHDGYNSEAIEVGGPDHLVVLRMREHLPATRLPFKAVKQEIIDSLRHDEAAGKAEATATAILKQLHAGGDAKKLAAENKAEWKTRSGVTRTEKGLAPQMLHAVFSAPHPAGDKPGLEHTALSGGEQAILAVYGVHDGAIPKDASRAASHLERISADATFSEWSDGIRASAKVKINKEKP